VDNSKNEPPKKQPNTFIVLSGVGAQMGVTIWLGAQLGKWLDEKYPLDKNWFTIACVLFAVGISIYNLIVQVNRLNK